MAGTSVESYLAKFCCDVDYARVNDLLGRRTAEHVSEAGVIGSRDHSADNPKGRWHSHVPLTKIRENLENDDQFDNYLKIATVRNPWNNTISQFLRNNRTQSLAEYIEQNTFKEARRSLNRLSIDGEIQIDYGIRFEFLKQDIQILLTGLDIKEVVDTLPKHRTGKIRSSEKREQLANYRDFFTPELEQKVRQAYQPYIDHFQYQF